MEHWGTRLLLEFHSPDLAVEPPTTAVRDGEHEAPCRSAGTLLLRARRYGPGKWIEGTGYTHTPAMLQRLTSALLHKSAIGQGIPNPKKIYAAATVWGVPRAVN